MKRFLTVLLLVFVTVLTGCDKTATIRKTQEKAIELRIYNRNILKATNDARADGTISASLHRGVVNAGEKFSKALDITDQAVLAWRQLPTKQQQDSQLDFIQRLIDSDVFDAFMDILDAVASFPPDVKAKIQEYIAAAKLVFASIRALFADSGVVILRRLDYV